MPFPPSDGVFSAVGMKANAPAFPAVRELRLLWSVSLDSSQLAHNIRTAWHQSELKVHWQCISRFWSAAELHARNSLAWTPATISHHVL